jgi:glyoxylase-like metal-dependent hydrolase (beta-lactamase superfamily II)
MAPGTMTTRNFPRALFFGGLLALQPTPMLSDVLLKSARAESQTPRNQAVRRLPNDAQVVLTHEDEYYGDRRVGTYVSSTWGFSTSSYFIEGPTGLILIDTQFLPSATEELLRWAEEATGKKVALAIVLHANPDKFNGTAVLKKRGIRVVTSSQVRAMIPAVHEKRLRAFYDRYKPDYPKDLTLPDSFGDKTTELSAAGLTVKAHVLGPGCSEAHVAVEWDGHLFVGDLVAAGSHSWLEIGRTDEWLKRLDELAALKPSFIHPGRGPSGDERLLRQERSYLQAVIDAVAAEKPGPASIGKDGKLDDAAEKAIERAKARLEDRYLGYRFAVFLDIGLPAEWKRQAQGQKPR